MLGVVAGEAVEVCVEGIEAGASAAAIILVPSEGRAIMAEIADEGYHVGGGTGKGSSHL